MFSLENKSREVLGGELPSKEERNERKQPVPLPGAGGRWRLSAAPAPPAARGSPGQNGRPGRNRSCGQNRSSGQKVSRRRGWQDRTAEGTGRLDPSLRPRFPPLAARSAAEAAAAVGGRPRRRSLGALRGG